MIVEYAAEPVRPGLFRKLSVFRIGDQFLAHACVHDTSWLVKAGRYGIADEDLYDDELALVRENRFVDRLKPAFDVAQIDYGRADFGLVGGQICVYEINTNPLIQVAREHPYQQRLETVKLWRERLNGALADIQTNGVSGDGTEIDVSGESVEALNDALARFPRLQNGYWRLAREYTRRSNKAAAIDAIRSGIAQSPDDIVLRLKLSELLAKKRPEEALAILDRVVELIPHKPDPLLAKARLLIQVGRLEAARDVIAKAFAMKPDQSRLHRALRYLQQSLGTQAAVKAAELALKWRTNPEGR
jgi:tetratricopeptide (TPR) repeat protein